MALNFEEYMDEQMRRQHPMPTLQTAIDAQFTQAQQMMYQIKEKEQQMIALPQVKEFKRPKVRMVGEDEFNALAKSLAGDGKKGEVRTATQHLKNARKNIRSYQKIVDENSSIVKEGPNFLRKIEDGMELLKAKGMFVPQVHKHVTHDAKSVMNNAKNRHEIYIREVNSQKARAKRYAKQVMDGSKALHATLAGTLTEYQLVTKLVESGAVEYTKMSKHGMLVVFSPIMLNNWATPCKHYTEAEAIKNGCECRKVDQTFYLGRVSIEIHSTEACREPAPMGGLTQGQCNHVAFDSVSYDLKSGTVMTPHVRSGCNSTCWGTFGAMAKKLMAGGNLGQIVQMMHHYAHSYNIHSMADSDEEMKTYSLVKETINGKDIFYAPKTTDILGKEFYKDAANTGRRKKKVV